MVLIYGIISITIYLVVVVLVEGDADDERGDAMTAALPSAER